MTQNNEREMLDVRYFNEKLRLVLEDLPNYTRSGLARELQRLSNTASPISQNEQQLKQIPEGWKLVPIESDEQMKDEARVFLAGLELGVKTFESMSEHLRLSGAYLPDWFLTSKGHINKMAKSHYIYESMLSAAPSETNTEVGE